MTLLEEVPTIVMPKKQARRKLRALHERKTRRAKAEWEAAEKIYKELAEGTPLIHLDKVFQQAINEERQDEKFRPMLAIARADRKHVSIDWEKWGRGRMVFSTNVRHVSPYTLKNGHSLSVVVEPGYRAPKEFEGGSTLVPTVPPEVKDRVDLRKHFILWEVENWSQVPPVDPLLLKPIWGPIYAIIDAWDLTEVEQAILGAL